jgi:hypothetical protein
LQDMEKRIRQITEYCYLIVLAVWLFCLETSVTTMNLPENIVTRYCMKAVIVVSSLCFLIKLLLAIRERAQASVFLRFLIAVIAALVVFKAFRASQYDMFKGMAFLLLGSVGISNRKILKTYLISVGCVIFLTVVSALGGFITNLVYDGKNGHIRSSWGFGFPTDMATIILFWLLVFWCVYGARVSDELVLLLSFLSLYVAYGIAYSYTSTIGNLLLIVGIILVIIMRSRGKAGFIGGMIRVFAVLAFPLSAAFIFGVVYAYSRGMHFAAVLNDLMSDRIRLSLEAFEKYAITPWGNIVNQVGNGGSTYGVVGYNFIDSSYVLMLIRFGWVFFLLLLLCWEYMAVRAAKRDYRLLIVMIIIAVHSIAEHHFPEMNVNIFLLLPFTSFDGAETITEKVPFGKSLKGLFSQAWRHLPVTAGVICLVLAAPRLLSLMRVVASYRHWENGGSGQYRVIVLLVLSVLVAGLFLWGLDMLWRRQRPPIGAGLLAVSLAAALAGGWKLNGVVESEAAALDETMTQESVALGTAISNSSGSVYVERLAEVYRRRFGSVVSSVFDGDELARYENVTVVTDVNNDSDCFFHHNCLFTQISDTHGLYTNDPQVIEALEEQGYVMSGYYPVKHSLDLEEVASVNSLPYDGESITLSGYDNSVVDTGETNLRDGKYTVTYSLHIRPDEYTDDYAVCTLRIKSNNGRLTKQITTVMRSDFDEEGNCVFSITLNTSSSFGVDFSVYAVGDQELEVSGITWQKTPDYDVHNTYEEGRLVRKDYYDLEGKPVDNFLGYHTVIPVYDESGEVTKNIYYNLKGEKWEKPNK